MTREEVFTWDGIRAGITIHEPGEGLDGSRSLPLSRSLTLYLHGGGLLYGERDDLPKPYVDAFVARGCKLMLADYPLAPETPIRGINAFVDGLWQWVAGTMASLLGAERIFVFGRSAGAYLALTLSSRIAQSGSPVRPTGVIDFYGYGDMCDERLTVASKHYQQYSPVSSDSIRDIVSDAPVTSGPMSERYSLYVYARQNGCWQSMLGLQPDERDPNALTPSRQSGMPPVFYAASTADEDVPYAVSKSLARALHAKMFTAYGLEHDFDRDIDNPAGLEAYEKCLDWMEGLVQDKA
ncbi:alpha/beta hydrolase [Olsenella sp. Marseille-P4559]|uniref:alpha/beta hydrolase n=1 Tax=Olsenella sp. Marseille-P4559 TaxID=2364795 RepID=UPI0010321CD7|nr:alpha/beta hydrolase [Olsenella sp. Marseille-P4559]